MTVWDVVGMFKVIVSKFFNASHITTELPLLPTSLTLTYLQTDVLRRIMAMGPILDDVFPLKRVENSEVQHSELSYRSETSAISLVPIYMIDATNDCIDLVISNLGTKYGVIFDADQGVTSCGLFFEIGFFAGDKNAQQKQSSLQLLINLAKMVLERCAHLFDTDDTIN